MSRCDDGPCAHDATCGDLHCEGHPRNAGFCSTCYPGPCKTPLVCQVPLAEIRPIQRRLFTRRRFTVSRTFLVGALFAVPGVAIFIVEGLRYFLNQH